MLDKQKILEAADKVFARLQEMTIEELDHALNANSDGPIARAFYGVDGMYEHYNSILEECFSNNKAFFNYLKEKHFNLTENAPLKVCDFYDEYLANSANEDVFCIAA